MFMNIIRISVCMTHFHEEPSSYRLLQIEEFAGLSDEQRTAFKWKFLLERCKIHLKVVCHHVAAIEY